MAPTMPIISENLQAIIDAAKKQQEDQAEQARLAEVKRHEEKEQQDKAEAQRREDRARRHKEHKEHKERKRLRALAGGNHTVTPSSASTPMVSSSNGHGSGGGGRDAKDERILLGNFAKVVPNAIAKYGERLGKEEIKKRAKEICKILVAKEMRKHHDQRDLNSDMAEAKKLKVKQFAKEFMHKVLKHQDAKLQRKDSVTDHANGTTDRNVDGAAQASGASSPAHDGSRSVTTSPAELNSGSPDGPERSVEATPSSKRSVAELEGGDGGTADSGENSVQRPGKQQKLEAIDGNGG